MLEEQAAERRHARVQIDHHAAYRHPQQRRGLAQRQPVAQFERDHATLPRVVNPLQAPGHDRLQFGHRQVGRIVAGRLDRREDRDPSRAADELGRRRRPGAGASFPPPAARLHGVDDRVGDDPRQPGAQALHAGLPRLGRVEAGVAALWLRQTGERQADPVGDVVGSHVDDLSGTAPLAKRRRGEIGDERLEFPPQRVEISPRRLELDQPRDRPVGNHAVLPGSVRAARRAGASGSMAGPLRGDRQDSAKAVPRAARFSRPLQTAGKPWFAAVPISPR